MNADVFYGNRFSRLNIHYIGIPDTASINNNHLACTHNFGNLSP